MKWSHDYKGDVSHPNETQIQIKQKENGYNLKIDH